MAKNVSKDVAIMTQAELRELLRAERTEGYEEGRVDERIEAKYKASELPGIVSLPGCMIHLDYYTPKGDWYASGDTEAPWADGQRALASVWDMRTASRLPGVDDGRGLIIVATVRWVEDSRERVRSRVFLPRSGDPG